MGAVLEVRSNPNFSRVFCCSAGSIRQGCVALDRAPRRISQVRLDRPPGTRLEWPYGPCRKNALPAPASFTGPQRGQAAFATKTREKSGVKPQHLIDWTLTERSCSRRQPAPERLRLDAETCLRVELKPEDVSPDLPEIHTSTRTWCSETNRGVPPAPVFCARASWRH